MTSRIILVLTCSTLQIINIIQNITTYLNDGKKFNTEHNTVSDRLVVNKLKLNLDKTRNMLLHQSKNRFWKNIDFI